MSCTNLKIGTWQNLFWALLLRAAQLELCTLNLSFRTISDCQSLHSSWLQVYGKTSNVRECRWWVDLPNNIEPLRWPQSQIAVGLQCLMPCFVRWINPDLMPWVMNALVKVFLTSKTASWISWGRKPPDNSINVDPIIWSWEYCQQEKSQFTTGYPFLPQMISLDWNLMRRWVPLNCCFVWLSAPGWGLIVQEFHFPQSLSYAVNNWTLQI